ncbi:MAG: D-2-hydroxyacid dehydrogenase [Acutalibacteraceae bacterium]|jgi:glycerate dehydrogenase|nr:D-2-hydroxyacid dehydrogenase [Clostridia bacterium]MBQ1550039.1 D-2-hydroxyacid dehydrogenase [Clostridia bacterium]MEE3311078.1 D-2-hydroxyacid dehydrogenase [Acutalibacteraceae bacterium]
MKVVMPEYNTLTRGDIDMSGFETIGDLVVLDHPTKAELKAELADADILFVNKWNVDEDLLSAAPRLRYVGECATGYNNIDIAACKRRGIVVTNVPAYSTDAVAQQVFAFLLEHFARVHDYNDFVKDGGWVRSGNFSEFCFPTAELAHKTIGLVGYGRIGSKVASIAKAFGMNVLATSRSFLSGYSGDGLAQFVPLDTLLAEADVVSVHCPLNEDSLHLFDAKTFAKMKEGAFFINTARGPIVSEKALAAALKSGHLSGAAVDVIEEEPMKEGSVLLGVDNCIVTPHVAWAPKETRQRLVDVVLSNVYAWLEKEPFNVVDVD